jgi:hypothetical protein
VFTVFLVVLLPTLALATYGTMVMKKAVAAIRSNYIPWKGYFDIIHDVDLFIFRIMLNTQREIGETGT